MKKIMLTIALGVFAFVGANAQEAGGGYQKGDVFISGAVGFSSQESGATESSTFKIAPRVGYFINENIAIGGHLGYQSSSAETAEIDSKDLNTISVGAFGRYYFLPTHRFSVFGQLGINYLSVENDLLDTTSDGLGIAVAPGISYFVSDNFALEATFGILGYQSVSPDGGDSTDTFNIGVDTENINLGVVYKF